MMDFFIPIFLIILAFMLCGGGLFILHKHGLKRDEHGHLNEIDLPLFGKVKTNYPSLIVIFLGAGLAFFVTREWVEKPVETMKIVAKVNLVGNPEAERQNVILAVFPFSHHKETNNLKPPGEYEIIIPAVDKSRQYQAIAYMVSGYDSKLNKPEYIIDFGSVDFNEEKGYGEFNATLRMK